MKDKFLDALDSVTWYNGLAETVFKWYFLEPDTYSIKCPDKYCLGDDESRTGFDQLQIMWMIAVELFGDCGTSPRFGWIEKVDEFRKWILEITETWRGSEEYNGPEEYRFIYE